jgi:hypothetical protein
VGCTYDPVGEEDKADMGWAYNVAFMRDGRSLVSATSANTLRYKLIVRHCLAFDKRWYSLSSFILQGYVAS